MKVEHYKSCELYIPDVNNCSCGADQYNKAIDDVLEKLKGDR